MACAKCGALASGGCVGGVCAVNIPPAPLLRDRGAAAGPRLNLPASMMGPLRGPAGQWSNARGPMPRSFAPKADRMRDLAAAGPAFLERAERERRDLLDGGAAVPARAAGRVAPAGVPVAARQAVPPSYTFTLEPLTWLAMSSAQREAYMAEVNPHLTGTPYLAQIMANITDWAMNAKPNVRPAAAPIMPRGRTRGPMGPAGKRAHDVLADALKMSDPTYAAGAASYPAGTPNVLEQTATGGAQGGGGGQGGTGGASANDVQMNQARLDNATQLAAIQAFANIWNGTVTQLSQTERDRIETEGRAAIAQLMHNISQEGDTSEAAALRAQLAGLQAQIAAGGGNPAPAPTNAPMSTGTKVGLGVLGAALLAGAVALGRSGGKGK